MPAASAPQQPLVHEQQQHPQQLGTSGGRSEVPGGVAATSRGAATEDGHRKAAALQPTGTTAANSVLGSEASDTSRRLREPTEPSVFDPPRAQRLTQETLASHDQAADAAAMLAAAAAKLATHAAGQVDGDAKMVDAQPPHAIVERQALTMRLRALKEAQMLAGDANDDDDSSSEGSVGDQQ